jgi:hypothetical protein
VNPNGAKSLTFNPQSDVEGMLAGVVNNSGHTIYSITYSITLSGKEPFEFDQDFGLGSGETGYEGPEISFTVFNSGLGIVHFNGGLPNGGTAYFGLEGAPRDTHREHSHG